MIANSWMAAVSNRRQAVLQRRHALLAKIASQREELAELGAYWQTPLHFADWTLGAVHFLRSHALLVAGLAGLALVKRRGARVVLNGVWRIWKAYHFFKEAAKKITAQL